MTYVCDICSCWADNRLCGCDVKLLRDRWRAFAGNVAVAAFGQVMFDAGRDFQRGGRDMMSEGWRPNVDGKALGREGE